MYKQRIRRLVTVDVDETRVVVPVTAECFYDEENVFVISVPKVHTSEARYEPYRMIAVPDENLATIKDKAIVWARHYDWQLAYEKDTKPV